MNRDYSRTEYVFGSDALHKMQQATFLIIGADGLAQEIAKNLALTGVSAIRIFDPTPVSYRDLSSSPFLRIEDAKSGAPRDKTIAPHIQQLNPLCAIDVVTNLSFSSIKELIQPSQVVIQTCSLPNLPLGHVGDVCHAAGVPYVLCTTNGLSGRLFCDFLARHTVLDVDGERCEDITLSNCIIEAAPSHIGNSGMNGWRFFFATSKVHELSDGYTALIRDLKFVAVDGKGAQQTSVSMEHLEKLVNQQVWTVSITGHSRFEAVPCNSSVAASICSFLSELKHKGFEALHLRGGYVKRIKEPLDMPFLPYSEAAKAPQYSDLMVDFSKLGRSDVLHSIYCAITEVMSVGHPSALSLLSPETAWNNEMARTNLSNLIDFCNEHKSSCPLLGTCLPELTNADNRTLLETFLMTYNGQIAPLVSFMGGWGAQEALKSVSGKYTPIHQFYYYECFEALPPRDSPFHPLNGGFESLKTIFRPADRYEGQRMLFGDRLQDIISSASLFVIGAGALGCELLKQFALIGAATSPQAILELTDLDNIENSNLSRQFLFREKDIGKMKADVAAASVKLMNPELNINARCLRVGEETEDILNSDFWLSKTVIINALDNVPTRMYVDGKCCLYRKALLESGTLGQKANMQVIVPWLTETYGSQRDPETGDDPACTIHNFPNTIVHCIVYATSEFKGVFEQGCADFAKLKADGLQVFIDGLLKNKDTIETRLLQMQTICMKLPSCVNLIDRACNWACALFEKYFILTIEKILSDFPVDAKDKDGNNFWSGEKRPPHKLVYDANNPIHRDFILTAARLYTIILGKEVDISSETVASIATGYFATSPSSPAKATVLTREVAAKQISNSLNYTYNNENISKLLADDTLFDQEFLTQLSVWGVTPRALIFEKDDLTNGHVQYIASLANLRAENYDIPTIDYNEARRLSGSIIPAMVTTTASVVGLVGIEFYKVLLWNNPDLSARHPLSNYKSAFFNFALPSLQLSEPGPCNFVECSTTKERITPWDNIELPKTVTVQEVIDYFHNRYKGDVDSIIFNTRMVYSSFGNGEAVLHKRLAELVNDPPGQIFFIVGCSDPDTYDEIEVPKLCLVN